MYGTFSAEDKKRNKVIFFKEKHAFCTGPSKNTKRRRRQILNWIIFSFLIRKEVFTPEETLISPRPLNSHSPSPLFPRNPLSKRDKYNPTNFGKPLGTSKLLMCAFLKWPFWQWYCHSQMPRLKVQCEIPLSLHFTLLTTLLIANWLLSHFC